MDYYEILEIDENCTKEEIKKKFHLLCLRYHPDKNNGEDSQFKKINEAYGVLYDDEKRKQYNIQRLFKNIEFTEEDHKLFQKYYQQLIHSKEFRLMKLLYQSIPNHVKQKIWTRFKQKNNKSLVKSKKTIDITQLNETISIHLVVRKEDKENKNLKIFYIFAKTGTYYFYLREFKDLVINNLDCYLLIHFI